MNLRQLALLFTALLGLAATAIADTKATEATVAKVSGAATVTMPDGSTTALTAGMKVTQGSTIKTGADGDVFIESHAGYLTAIKKDSEVGVDEISVTTTEGKVTAETTTLNLKSGDLVAKLDPSKKAVNHYAVRTPKGVAAARGTVFTVRYKGSNVTIVVVNGVVSVVAPGLFNTDVFRGISGQGVNTTDHSQATETRGGRVTVSAGQTLSQDLSNVNSGLGTTTSYSGASDSRETQESLDQANSIKELLALAVATVADAAQHGYGGTTAADAAEVAKAVFTAVPSAASEAAALMKQSGVTNAEVTNAVKNEVPAAQQASFDSSLQSGTFEQTTLTTTTTTGTATVASGRSSRTVTTTTTTTTTTPTTTTPQPIDPAQISRSN